IYTYIKSALKPVNPDSEEVVEVEIPIGSGLDAISKILEERGIIRNAKVFKYYAKFNNESQFQAGSYGLTKAMTLDEIMKSLKTGVVYRKPVFTMTNTGGLTVRQIAKIVSKNAGIEEKEFLHYVNSEETVNHYIAAHPEVFTDEMKNDK